MRSKKGQLCHTTEKVSRCILVAVTAFALALQPCFVSPAYAVTGDYDKESDYPDWDDPEYRYNYYWSEDAARKVTNVTRNYSDGTKYTASYQYNEQGNMTDANIKEADGSKITIKRVYDGEEVISSTLYEYDTSDKSELNHLTEYGDSENPTHQLYTVKYSDKTTSSREMWYFGDGEYNPIKRIDIDRDGTTTQEENVYNTEGRLLTSKTTCSNGSESLVENQYDEDGGQKYYKYYEYDALLKSKCTEESWLEGDEVTGTFHTIETNSSEGSGEMKVETWSTARNEDLIKKITTNSDGTQSTEEYFYNQEGKETLYTKTGSDGIVERRETVITTDRTTRTYTDGRGMRVVTNEYEDVINDLLVTESTITNADGSSSYTQQSYGYNENGRNYTFISRNTTADGIETYIEVTLGSEGKSTKTRTADGSVTIEKEDGYGNLVSKTKTLPDGTTAETSWEMREDGELGSEITRYSDGSEDRINFEYDEDGRGIQITESRRNGVTAVTQIQYGADDEIESGTITYNNGYSVAQKSEKLDKETTKETTIDTATFSHGEISQIILTDSDSSTQLKLVYRDGRTEERSASMGSNWSENYQIILEVYNKCFEDFETEAWAVLPNQADAAAQTAAAVDEALTAAE